MQLLLPASFGYYFEAVRQTQISIDLLPSQAFSVQFSIEYETYSVFETILHKLQNEYVQKQGLRFLKISWRKGGKANVYKANYSLPGRT